MKKIRNGILLSVLLVPITMVVFYAYLFSFPIHYTEDFNLLMGMMGTPLIVGVSIFILLKTASLFRKNLSHWVHLGVIFSMIFAEILFFYPPIENTHHYFQELYKNRELYKNPEFYKNSDEIERNQEIIIKLQESLPQDWKVIQLEYQTEMELFWFSALEPSFWYGSIRHIGVYHKNKGLLDIISIKQIWNEVKGAKRLPEEEQFSYESGVRDILFDSNNEKYYVGLTVNGTEIEVHVTPPPPVPEGK